MAKRKKTVDEDEDVKAVPDDVDDDEALLGDEDEPEPEPEPEPGPKEDITTWKKKYYDAERSRSEIASEYRTRINQLQEELRESKKAALADGEESLDLDGRPAPEKVIVDTHEKPPYKLVKWVQERTVGGQVIMVPREIPGLSFEENPRPEEVPVQILVNWGPGEYKVRDGRGKIVGGFNITGAGAEGAPGLAPPAFNPANANIGQYMRDPMDRALTLFDEAKKRGDAKLMERAGQLMDKAIEGGGGVGGDFDKTLAMLKALNDYSAQARQLMMPPGGMPGMGGVEDKEVALKRLEMEANDKKWAGAERMISAVAEKIEKGIGTIVEKLKAPEADPNKVKDAAQRLGGGAQFVPSQQAPAYRPASPPPPPQPPKPKTAAPDGTVVRCGGCQQDFPIQPFLDHVRDGCPGGGAPAAQQGTPQMAAAPRPIGGAPMPEMNADLKTYLGYMKSLSNYIIAYNDGDNDAAPESVGKTVWLGVAMPGKEDDRAKLLSIVDMGYDQIVNRKDLNDLIAGLDTFPNFTPEQTEAFLEATILSGIMKPEEVNQLEDVGDLGPAMDEFKNHIAIQRSPKGREWICRLLNAIALKAGRPAPHAEFLPGSQCAQRGGADNL